MKKSVLALALICALCVCLWGCGEEAGNETDNEAVSEVGSKTFDPETEGILNVVIFDEKKEALSYEVIDNEGNRMLTEEFELDTMEVFSADPGSFQTSVVDGKTVNTVASVELFGEEGGQVVPDATVIEIFNQVAAASNRPILSLDILTCGGTYFPVVELEVQEKAPVILYHFNAETNKLSQLCRYDSVVIGGLQILDPDKLP